MPRTDVQFVDILRQIAVKEKAIKALGAQRTIDEQALNVTYQVNVVNNLKNQLALTHANAVKVLFDEIQVLRDSLTV